MNAAFRRNFMTEALDNYGFIIVAHLTLITFFEKNEAYNHWKKEVAAFKTTLQRYNKGKGSKMNLIPSQISYVLNTFLEDDNLLQLTDFISNKGLSLPAQPSWDEVRKNINIFAESFS